MNVTTDIPITVGFSNDPDTLIGHATIRTDNIEPLLHPLTNMVLAFSTEQTDKGTRILQLALIPATLSVRPKEAQL